MEKRNWYPEFYQYMDEIVGHPNYQGLPITKKADGTWGWITAKKARIGQARMAWCEAKARELGLYMQKYCGCIYSEEDRFSNRRKKELHKLHKTKARQMQEDS